MGYTRVFASMQIYARCENKNNNNVIQDDIDGTDGKVYELGYLLVSTISEESIPVAYGNLKDLVINLGGEIISDEIPKMISLAYTMLKVTQNVRNKFNSAYFGWVKFEMNPEKV